MRSLLFSLSLLLPLSVSYAAPAPETAAAPEAPAPVERKWLQPEAEFRLTAIPERPAEASSIDLRRLVLPVLPSNGVRVFDDAGNAVPFQLHDNFSLSIAPAQQAKHFEIYFGYPAPQPFDTWTDQSGARPPSQRLKLNFYWGGSRPCTPEEFLARRNMEIARGNRWHTRNFANRPFVLMRQAITGFEIPRGVPKFPQYYKNYKNLFKRLHTRNRGQWLRTAAELNGYPYCERMRRFNASLPRQMKSHLDYMKREIARIDGQYAQAKKDMERGAENDLLAVAGWRNPQEFIATEVQLVVRPPETSEHYSARFSGFLEVPEDGEYEFKLISNSLALLRLDGEVTARRVNANGSQPAETVIAKKSLKKGSVFFEQFYRLNSGYGQMTLQMRPAGKGEFRLLAAEHFTPARPATPVMLESSKGVEFPLLSRRGHYLLYTGKQSHIPIESFDFLTHEDKLEWHFGASDWRPLDELSAAVIPGNTPETTLSFRRIGQPETELAVLNSDYRADLVELRPDLQLRLWAPEIIYDDEELLISAETLSRLPLEIEAQLDISIDDKPQELRRVRLPAKPDERFNRSAADIYRKDTIALPPRRTKKIDTVEMTLAIENFEFDRRKARILPVASENLASWSDAGNAVVLVLHRPKLSDIRNWELPRKIGDELAPYRKLLLIGESVDGFERLAAEQLKTREKQAVEFVPFADSETPLRDRLPELLDRIGENTADRAVLFLPCLHHMGTIEPWMRDRYIAAILEKLRRNRKLHAIYLIPAPVRPGEEQNQEELQEALRRLAREYDVQLLEPATVPAPTGTEHPFHTPEEFLPLLKTLHEKL